MLTSLSQPCAIALNIPNTSVHDNSFTPYKGEQSTICNKLPLMGTNSDMNFANGVASCDGYEMWEVSNTILLEECRNTLFIHVQNS